MKIFLIGSRLWLLCCAGLILLASQVFYSNSWMDQYLNSLNLSAKDNRQHIVASSYEFGRTSPIFLGDIKEQSRAYILVKMRFRADSLKGHPNIFQTAPFNKGLRLELSDSSGGVIVPDLTLPGGLKGLPLGVEIKVGKWYSLEVEAVNQNRVTVKLDGRTVAKYASSGLYVDMSKILVGEGFDSSRGFQGKIEQINLTKGNLPFFLGDTKNIFKYLLFLLLFVVVLHILSLKSRLNPSLVGAVIVLVAVCLFNALFFDRYFPITEGWFSAYSHLIREGLIPYRDFYLFLTPLYPLQIAVFQAIFGESFICLRILGVIVVLLISLLLYKILVRKFTVVVSVITTITAVIYYQSGVAHITYDFIQLFTLYVLAASYLIICSNDKSTATLIEDKLTGYLQLFFAGILIAMAFLTKQSNGALIVIFSLFVVALVTSGHAIKYRVKYISVYIAGMVFPVICTGMFLYFNGAIKPFVDQIFFGAIQAKGSVSGILFSWIGKYANVDYLIKLITVLAWIVLFFTWSIAGRIFPKLKQVSIENKTQVIRQVLMFFVLFSVAITLGCYGSLVYKSWILLPGLSLAHSIFAFSTFMVIFLLIFSDWKLLGEVSAHRKYILVVAIISIGLIFGNGTSGGVGEVSLFLSFSLALATVMSLPNLNVLPKILIVLICLSFILLQADAKFRQPYAWWYITEGDVLESSTQSTLPLLAGFKLSRSSSKVFEDVVNTIQKNSKPEDDVFTFPNIPGIYVLANRWPHSKVVVSWFDFLPDGFAMQEAKRLRNSPPVVIVNLKLPDAAWTMHESLFRDGKALGQRDIQAAILELTEQRKLYQLDLSREVSPGCVLDVWHRKNMGHVNSFRETKPLG